MTTSQQMNLTIKSRKLGDEVMFARHDYYIKVRVGDGGPWRQPCAGGGFTGLTLAYAGDDERTFARICRRWYSKHIKS